jgi:hypothetical protein
MISQNIRICNEKRAYNYAVKFARHEYVEDPKCKMAAAYH